MGASGENNLWVRQWGNNDQQKNELIIKKIVKTFHWLILNCGYKRREKCCGILSEKFALKVNKGMQFFMNFNALKIFISASYDLPLTLQTFISLIKMIWANHLPSLSLSSWEKLCCVPSIVKSSKFLKQLKYPRAHFSSLVRSLCWFLARYLSNWPHQSFVIEA